MTLEEMTLLLLENGLLSQDLKYNIYTGKYEAGDYKLEVKWEIGGADGGNCWDDSEARPYTTDKAEPQFQQFYDVLLLLVPDLTLRDSIDISREVIHHDAETEREYYGNYTQWGVKYVRLPELYEALQKRGLLK